MLNCADEHLQTSSVAKPQFYVCCPKRKIWLERASDPLCILRSLLAETGSTARQPGQNIRAWITALFKTSVKASCGARRSCPLGLTTAITMKGRVYHYMSAMMPATGREPEFLSALNHDKDYDTRCQAESEGGRLLRPTVLAGLTATLHLVSPACRPFKVSVSERTTTSIPRRVKRSFIQSGDPRLITFVEPTVLRRR